MSDLTLRVLALYPDQMNIYADRGNLLFLEQRCRRRGIGFELAGVGHGEGIDPSAQDLIYMGGGQDSDQRAVAADLRASKRSGLFEAIEQDVAMLAVCGGYQLLGSSYTIDDERIEGLGIADLETVREPGERLIGNVVIEAEPLPGGEKMTVAGFENHGGRTYLGTEATPFGSVVSGHGNNGGDGYEGIVYRSVIGTYLHGPLLPKNHELADLLIARALSRSAGQSIELDPLDDELERRAHDEARKAATGG